MITIEYQTQRNYCSCCNQKLPKTETSKIKRFSFDKETALSWTDWDSEYPEDMEAMVPDFVHETISFYATNSYEEVIVADSEVEKVKEFILREFASQTGASASETNESA